MTIHREKLGEGNMSNYIVKFKVEKWLPCTEKIARQKTTEVGKSSITLNDHGLIDSIIITTGSNVLALCSKDYIIDQSKIPNGYEFVKV